MSRARALLAVVAIWAAIFLPGLGSTEIKGEEGRRILPALAMLETGDWIVPRIAGAPYLRKPPLMNWLIALSYKATGLRNEWAARIPSVMAILALALTTVLVAGGWLGIETAFVAAVVMMTNIGIIEKGRLAEIEAVYFGLSGIAMVCWLSWWAQRKSRWLVWTVPFVFLGLAALAKGPVHLLFFYAVVVAALHARREWRALFSWPHAVGILVMAGIFAAWAIPYFHETARLGAAGIWASQMQERVAGGDFDAGSYAANFPRALGNFLPWLLAVPLWWRRGCTFQDPGDERLFVYVRNAVPGCFVVMMLVPGVLPRYTLPLFAPAALLTATALVSWRPVFAKGDLKNPACWVGAVCGAAMILYAIFIVPRVNGHATRRVLGQQISRAVPKAAALFACEIGYEPALFYVRPEPRYVADLKDLPDEAEGVLVRREVLPKLRNRWGKVEVRAEMGAKRGRSYAVVTLQDRLR